jgi:threonyl-tRNA synthetase
MDKIKLTFPDGTIREYDKGVTGKEVAQGISQGLAREALAVEVNGQVWDLARNINNDATFKVLKWDDDGGKHAYWHSSAHLMAEAIESLYPGTKFAIGPAIETGFYYDIDMADHSLSPDELAKIEERMYEFAKRDVPYVRQEKSWDEAVAYFKQKGDQYKLELLDELKGKQITFYEHGNYVDLCMGPHIPSTGRIKAIKLLSLAGAYWRGSEKNKMLQRIYGVTFPSKKELDAYLFRLEEAKRRDHRKLGKELELFMFHDIAPGAPFWHPKGMIIFRELEKFIREELDARDYLEISTPIMVKKDLWEQSGHWEHYQENMFKIEADDTIYSLKPMNCPESTYIYRHKTRSYKDLPLRYAEIGRLHRNEISGALGGMFRVRQITMDDAHIYCRPDQILSEVTSLLELVMHFYAIFGLKPTFNLSTISEDAMGDRKLLDYAVAKLKEALETSNIPYKLKPNDGAFYGPKIDIQIEDAIGRAWQISTIQLDFVMLPERFELEYIDEDGSRKRPVAIHRAIFGSFERFLGIITEHFVGAFPVWLSPVQAIVLPITDDHMDYAKSVFDQLKNQGIRVELDDRHEKIGFKIRDAETKKIPYMLVVGQKEKESGNVALRQHKKGDVGAMPLQAFIEKITKEIKEKTITT